MRKSKIIATLVAGGLSLATTNILGQAEPGQGAPQPSRTDKTYNEPATTTPDATQPTPSGRDEKRVEKYDNLNAQHCFKASHIVGTEVRSDTGDHLGRVQDLIVSVESGLAPFAIVKEGGALGIGGMHVAVPLRDLKFSEDTKVLTLAATKEQFTAANTSPTGAWAGIASEEWARNIDRYYGQPSGVAKFERQEMQNGTPNQEFVRTPSGAKPADQVNPKSDDKLNQIPTTDQSLKTLASKPADREIKNQVSKLLDQKLGAARQDVKITVDNGLVTLKGKVENAQAKRDLEDQIKAIPGVDQVDDQIMATNQ